MNVGGAKRRGNRARPRQAGLRHAIGGLWWSLFAGTLVFLAFPFRAVPDSGFWPLAWFALAPLLWALRDAGPGRAFVYGWAAGIVTNIGGFWWIVEVLRDFGHLPPAVAWPVSILNAVYQGLQFGLFALVIAWLQPRGGGLPNVALVAGAFTALEHVFPMIFPWYLANSQSPFPPATQIAELAGNAGVTFTLVFANGVVVRAAEAIFAREPLKRAQVATGVALVAGVLIYGVVRVGQVDAAVEEAPKLKVGMVEADIGIWEKEAAGLSPRERSLTLHDNLLTHHRMSRELAEEGADLVVWPESSYFPLSDAWGKRLDAFAAGVGSGGRLALWRDLGDSGFQWTPGPGLDAGDTAIRAVAAAREDAVVLAGDRGVVRMWDGREVRAVEVPEPPGAPRPDLHAVAVVEAPGFREREDGAPVRIWAAGEHGALYSGGPDGLRAIPTDGGVTLRSLAMGSARRGIAVGDQGTLLVVGDDGAHPIDLPTDEDLLDAWVRPGSLDFLAVGRGGTVVRSTREGWTEETPPTGATLRAIAGTRSGPVWIVGDGGIVLRRDGAGDAPGEWTREDFPETLDLRAVAVAPRGEVLVSDARGGLWRRVGAGRWEREEAPDVGPLRALTGLSWTRMLPIPKDARYLYQSDVPPPDRDAFFADPSGEMRLPTGDRGAVQRGFTTPILFGAITWKRETPGDPDSRRLLYNTAVLLDDAGRVVGMYDKVHLLVFGEYIPFGDVFPVFYEWLPAASRFEPGDEVRAFDWNGTRLGVLVCYEDILPGFTSRVAERQPQVLVNLTNDAWFGRTSEPYLHLALARMRTVELRRALVRSTNTGISAIIDPVGRLVEETRLDDPETVLAEVPLLTHDTVYGRFGDRFAQAIVAWIAVLLVFRRLRRRRA